LNSSSSGFGLSRGRAGYCVLPLRGRGPGAAKGQASPAAEAAAEAGQHFRVRPQKCRI